jgi:inosose dehydratase
LTNGPRLAGAPITWGVSEVPGWGRQLDRDRVLSEIAGAGFAATELGPPGFMPADPREIRRCLVTHGLELVGGFVPVVLHRDEIQSGELAAVESSARSLADAGGDVLILAATGGAGAGYEAAHALDDAEWETLARGIARAEAIGRSHGLRVTLHPHYGTVVGDDREIHRLLESTGVALCLDTGHVTVAGADPVAIARVANGRIGHVHLKDVSAELAVRVREGTLGYREAVRQGLYRPLGEGDVDLVALLALLRAAGYGGWYVVEQDVVIDPDRGDEKPLENALRSRRFLEEVMPA